MASRQCQRRRALDDQFAFGIPITHITVIGDSVVITMDAIGLEFSGQVSKDGRTASGVVVQDGQPCR